MIVLLGVRPIPEMNQESPPALGLVMPLKRRRRQHRAMSGRESGVSGFEAQGRHESGEGPP